MSNSSKSQHYGRGTVSKLPQAIIHKRILDAAEQEPEASVEELATKVSGASVDLVERVLEDYGDPADGPETQPLVPHLGRGEVNADTTQTDDTSESEDLTPETETISDSRTRVETNNEIATETDEPSDSSGGSDLVDTLSDVQRETLSAIAEHPEATQRELAQILNVSCATVNRRVNAIDGFAWDSRKQFVDNVFKDDEPTRKDHEHDSIPQSPGNTSADQHDVSTNCEDTADTPLDNPELAHKVLHACMASEQITEEEELEITKMIVDRCECSN